MTPQNHNKALVVIYGTIGMLALIGLLFIVMNQVNKTPPSHSTSSRLGQHVKATSFLKNVGPYLPLLLPPILQLITAYGLFMKRRWGRALALISSAFFVWLFPLGTGLAIYTWWFLQSQSGRSLYLKPSA
jgi:uncharacterized membrane protein (DUF2068 family)